MVLANCRLHLPHQRHGRRNLQAEAVHREELGHAMIRTVHPVVLVKIGNVVSDISIHEKNSSSTRNSITNTDSSHPDRTSILHGHSNWLFYFYRCVRSRFHNQIPATTIMIETYCAGVKAKYLASPMRKKSRKKRITP